MSAPRPRFDWLAPAYVWLERFSYGHRLQRCRTALLGELSDAKTALILGDGDGRFLEALLKSNPQIEVDSLDVSPTMIALARRRIEAIPGALERVRFQIADARTADFLPGKYDLIVTNFFLDCFPESELQALIARLVSSLMAGGRWLVGDFRLPEGRIDRRLAQIALAGMYLFFRAVTRIPSSRLVEPDPILQSHGLIRRISANHLRGFLAAVLWVKPETIPFPSP